MKGTEFIFYMRIEMLMGVATSATQIEGGDKNNTWYRFSKTGKCVDGTNCLRAADHYNRYREDTDLMASLGVEIYRMSLEWSRIEPQKGVFNKEAIDHYRDELEYFIEKGIKPLVTLHHFSDPIWFADMGGFEKKKNVKYFLEYVEKVIESFGDIVSEFVTINEPNVYILNGYMLAYWPPLRGNYIAGFRVCKNMARCHIEAYKLIHKMREEMGYKDTKVSFANHMVYFVPKNEKNPIHRMCTALYEYLFHTMINNSFYEGKTPLFMGKRLESGKYYDFIGINYYTRRAIGYFTSNEYKGESKSDLNWDIYPEGIRLITEDLYKKFKKEVYITENGICDKNDILREKYIKDHIRELVYEGSPVTRYYHWSFLDNFEWREGEHARFGLVHVNYETQKRTVRKSAEFYKRLIKEKSTELLE